MANINITSDAWTEISITSGTIQNISATADIELSAEQTDNSGVVLKPSELYQWDNETIYARAVTEKQGALRVVNFKKATGGGGSYVLPVATASKLGGVKIGGGLDIDASGVLSAPVNYRTTEQQIGTWINDKPLYQQTINIEGASSTGVKSYAINIANIDYVMLDESHSFLINNNPKEYIPIQNIWDTGGTGGYTLKPSANSLTFQWYRNIWQQLPAIITIQYTKTTD